MSLLGGQEIQQVISQKGHCVGFGVLDELRLVEVDGRKSRIEDFGFDRWVVDPCAGGDTAIGFVICSCWDLLIIQGFYRWRGCAWTSCGEPGSGVIRGFLRHRLRPFTG